MFDFLFERATRRPVRQEPRLDIDAVVAAAREVVVAVPSEEASPQRGCVMSPREMEAWVHEMYLAGWFSWEDYRTALPTEMHPDYDRTVGSLTGQAARPDLPRDMIVEWEERLAFARRHNTTIPVRRIERIVSLLRWQAAQVAQVGAGRA